MKRFLLLAAALGTVVFFARVEPSGQNIGSLQPVQVLVVSAGGDIRLKSDTGDEGFGDSVASALEKMRASASGEVFLDTADYLLISDAALLAEIEPYLRPSCRVCLFEGEPELKAQILSAVERAATDSAAVEFIRNQVEIYGGVEAARATLQRFIQRALSELSDLEDTPYRQALMDLCTFVVERDR